MLAAISLSLQLQRASFDLLDGVNIQLAVHNTSKSPASVNFKEPTEYSIEVLRDGSVMWSSSPARSPVAEHGHTKQFMPGPTVLAIYVWNEISSDGTTPAPGEYTIRARLLGESASPQASTRIRFVAPIPINALGAFRQGEEITIAGSLENDEQELYDAGGSVKLSRRLVNASDTQIAVRGYVIILPDKSREFFVERWAPLGS